MLFGSTKYNKWLKENLFPLMHKTNQSHLAEQWVQLSWEWYVQQQERGGIHFPAVCSPPILTKSVMKGQNSIKMGDHVRNNPCFTDTNRKHSVSHKIFYANDPRMYQCAF